MLKLKIKDADKLETRSQYCRFEFSSDNLT